jgi:hypothetical protein
MATPGVVLFKCAESAIVTPMPSSNVNFLLKVLGLSGAIGAVIKYLLPNLALPPSLGLAAFLLLAPSALMAGLFWLQPVAVDKDASP